MLLQLIVVLVLLNLLAIVKSDDETQLNHTSNQTSLAQSSDQTSLDQHSFDPTSFNQSTCHTNQDCAVTLANSWCDSGQCQCQFNFRRFPTGCFLTCKSSADCADYDQRQQCIEGLCMCAKTQQQDPSKRLCQIPTGGLSAMGLIIVCLMAGVTPLAVVILAVFCRTFGRRRDNQQCNNCHHQRLTTQISEPPGYNEVEDPPPSYDEVVRRMGFSKRLRMVLRQTSWSPGQRRPVQV